MASSPRTGVAQGLLGALWLWGCKNPLSCSTAQSCNLSQQPPASCATISSAWQGPTSLRLPNSLLSQFPTLTFHFLHPAAAEVQVSCCLCCLFSDLQPPCYPRCSSFSSKCFLNIPLPPPPKPNPAVQCKLECQPTGKAGSGFPMGRHQGLALPTCGSQPHNS